jgi:hypothetical protein
MIEKSAEPALGQIGGRLKSAPLFHVITVRKEIGRPSRVEANVSWVTLDPLRNRTPIVRGASKHVNGNDAVQRNNGR